MRHDWHNIVCVASGPSLSVEQCERVARSGWRVVVVNNTWGRIPSADALYACDGRWWQAHIAAVRASFRGELWTQDVAAAVEHGLQLVRCVDAPGLGRQPLTVHSGQNGGYQAINLAYHCGARRIILLGYDMQRTAGRAHWHADHPDGWGNARYPETWVPRFDALAADLEAAGVAVVNATTETALHCFPRLTLEEALC